MTLVLASASPRRRELLSLLGLPFVVRPVDVDEDMEDDSEPERVARGIARTKAEAARLLIPEAPILAADTVVAHGGRLLGKPRDASEARQMLRELRGETHHVVTAVALVPRGGRGILARHPITAVTMRSYTDDEIDASIARGDPFDKAGAYAIQDEVMHPVERYTGCYCNVVGLPLWPLIEMLRKLGTPPPVRVERLLPQCSTCPLRPPGD